MSDGHLGSDKADSKKQYHLDASDSLQNDLTGRAWQALLIGEGLVGGGIADAGKELKIDNVWNVGGSIAAGAALGAALGSKREILKLAVGGIGVVGGWMYTASKYDQYSKNKELGKALDAIYKHGDWTTFTKQTKTAEKVLGREGFDAALTGLSGSVGLAAGLKFAPGVVRKLSPATGDWMYGKIRADKPVSHVTSKLSATPRNPELSNFVNRISHGDVHVSSSSAGGNTYIFDKDYNVANIFLQKSGSHEIKQKVIVGSLLNRLGQDKAALEVVMAGAKKANYHGVEGIQRYGLEGSEAYLRQQPGNDYSHYLRKVQGEWSNARQQQAEASVVNVPIVRPPDAATHRVASETLAGLGIRPTEPNLAAAKNGYIRELDMTQRHDAIRAVSYHLDGHPRNNSLAAVDRIAALEKMSSNLTANQVDLITSRIGDFEPQDYPHHVFEGPIVSSVGRLVSDGTMKNLAHAHQLLCRLVGQTKQTANIEAAELLVQSAIKAGISEDQFRQRGITEAAGNALKKLLDNKQSYMISDLALSLKQLGTKTRYEDVVAVNTMRLRGWKAEEITAESVAKFLRVGQ